MENHLIFISASDKTGCTYSKIYVSDIGVEDHVITACTSHFLNFHLNNIEDENKILAYRRRFGIYEGLPLFYSGLCKIDTIIVDGLVIDNYTSAKSCIKDYKKLWNKYEKGATARFNLFKKDYKKEFPNRDLEAILNSM
jgi:hypothetical protein